jgi:glycosyltransferase involved in cell wall biosynthesis
MEKCRVAIIHNIIAPYRIPVFEELAKNPLVDLRVFYCAETHSHRNWEVNSCDTYDYTILSGTCVQVGRIKYHVNPSIVRELLHGNYDVIILGGCCDFTTQLAFIVSKLAKIPLILWSEGINSAQSKLGKLVSPLTNRIVASVDAVIVPGELSRQYHIECGAMPERVFIAPSVVDNEFYIRQYNRLRSEKNQLKKDREIKHDKVILYVGQLIERKGIQYLVSAYKLFKRDNNDACLVIVGDGPIRDNLQEICIKQKIDDVIFTGWVSEKEKVIYYSIADVFVLPTLEDVWGLVVNEAMCCGLPIITTNAAGCSIDLVENGYNGYIVDSGDAEQLYYALLNAFESPVKHDQMRIRSLEKIQRDFSVDATVNGFLSAIQYVKGRNNEADNDAN